MTRLDLRNSGDTSGDKRQVVGYGAWAFTAVEDAMDRIRMAKNAALLMIASLLTREKLWS